MVLAAVLPVNAQKYSVLPDPGGYCVTPGYELYPRDWKYQQAVTIG